MCLALRYTVRRTRLVSPRVRSTRARRAIQLPFFAFRFFRSISPLRPRPHAAPRVLRPISSLGSPGLAHLAAHSLGGVADALALVGFGWTDRAHIRRELPHQLAVDALDLDPHVAIDRDLETFRNLEEHGVREAKGEAEPAAVHLRAIADALDVEHLGEALGHAPHHVRDEGARKAVQGACRLAIVAACEAHESPCHFDGDPVGNALSQGPFGTLHSDLPRGVLHGDTGRDRDRPAPDPGHGYQTSHRSSPPTDASCAARPETTPFEVESTATPRPLRTFGISLAPT